MVTPKIGNVQITRMNNGNPPIGSKGTSGSLLSSFNRKRRHTFDVDLKIERVVSLPFATGRFFFKIRLLHGGNHVYTCDERFEVQENRVEFNMNDHFQVKMTSRVDNFILDHCLCRISIRREGRGSRLFEKIGYYDLDLASVAGSGDESKACLLNGYEQTNSSPANAYLEIRMKLTILEGDHIFRRPDPDRPYIKVDQAPSREKMNDTSPDESSPTLSTPSGELFPPPLGNHIRGHSRQASKSSMCSNQSTTSVNSANGSTVADKTHQRQPSDDENSQQSQRRLITSRRTPFIDQFGDIQRRLQSTRVDATDIVNSVMNDNAKPVQNGNGYLCLMYNDDGTARVGSSSSYTALHPPSSLFVST